jgi:hypothetical protein
MTIKFRQIAVEMNIITCYHGRRQTLDGKIEAVQYIVDTSLGRGALRVIRTDAQVEYKSAIKYVNGEFQDLGHLRSHFNAEFNRSFC